MIGLEVESFDGISAEALTFMGKGGLLIDTKVEDNRFNDYAFLASLMSFKLSGVENSLLCYSIYESFGDYIADIVTQLSDKTKSTTLTLSGETFSNQALWGRIQRNLSVRNPLLNQRYPIGKENIIYGAHFL
jgi:hydrogenase maturation factor HypF (carbamoyltransferase family)